MNSSLSFAVVGGGVAGITVAYLLSQKHSVTLFEKNDYLGGHTNTRVVSSGPDEGTAVDTGFIVCNPQNYPLFYQFLARLHVRLQDSDMSFGYCCPSTDLTYVGPAISDFVLTPLNFLKPKFLRMLLEQSRFNRRALADLSTGALSGLTLGEYLKERRVSQYFQRHYLTPLIASIWSSPDHDVETFPAETFVTFFRNHGMLELHKRPTWQTVVGGSFQYVKAFLSVFNGKVELGAPITHVSRDDQGVSVVQANGDASRFDKVVFATHADQALALLSTPTTEETRLLSEWRYHKSRAVLHTDERVLPQSKRLWASWNYVRRDSDAFGNSGVPITYYMNRLQNLRTERDYFVTLNSAPDEIDARHVLYETEYTHPAYTPRAVASQSLITQESGHPTTFFCGSYLGYGFHEDAVRSAVSVAEQFQCSL
ncbi:MAG: FAD-dependent oxidoreductase [Bdellovibrionales bacterium]|nr:FAD-dependent oxidoreductase [Bdellovibrionales bacterium]